MIENARAVDTAVQPRRDFLRTSMVMSLPLVTGTALFPRVAAAYTPSARSRGSTLRNVKNYGAVGDGIKDCTASFQKAIDSLPTTGGTVYVPAGTYLIDPVKSVRLRKLMHLQMHADAKLVAKPNSASKAYVLYAYRISDVEISGGRIVGDRDRHLGTSGEWGHGIQIRGSKRVTIRNVHISKCWGDGICIGGADVWNAPHVISDDVVVDNVVCTLNRRQGLSTGRANNVRIYDSEFSYTKGTKPECGIDVEPDDPGTAYKVLIDNCRLNNNAKYGLLMWKRSSSVTVSNCTVERNGSCGMVFVGISAVNIVSNTIRYNSATGLLLEDGTKSCTVKLNTFYGNYSRLGSITRTAFTQTGLTSRLERDIRLNSVGSGVVIGTNYYR